MENRVSPLLLAWYDAHGRDLPWRRKGMAQAGRPDPYRVWLSEIMLQQTSVAAARPYFERFVARWPDVASLAAAGEEAVLAQWAGLGYYSRARNLVQAARAVAARGGFPGSEAELRQLPGVGAYTAAAIAAIAFEARAVVIDANVERVVARLFAIGEPLPGARRAIAAAAAAITPEERAGDFAQAMMDLGASLCTARKASCEVCPLARLCRGRAGGDPLLLPMKPPRRLRPDRQGAAFWIGRMGAQGPEVWLVRRPARGLLGGMRALPDDRWSAGGDGEGPAAAPLLDPGLARWEKLGVVRHVFSHARLDMAVLALAGPPAPALVGKGEWWPLARLEEAGLPSLFAKAARLAEARLDAALRL